MIIKVLVENESNNNSLKCEHGLSLYIETDMHKLLFDVGQSNLFEENAEALDVDLLAVDTLFISHGHYDHGGGLARFLEINKQAKVYINQKAYGDYYSKTKNDELKYIGLDKATKNNPQINLKDNDYVIDQELSAYSGIQAEKCFPTVNKRLFMKNDELIVNDLFQHEQSLIIKYKNYNILIAGCAHSGIINIVNQINGKLNQPITHVISGFHMYNRREDKSEDIDIVKEVARGLDELGCECYTGHCTGNKAFKDLQDILGDKIHRIRTGDTITIN